MLRVGPARAGLVSGGTLSSLDSLGATEELGIRTLQEGLNTLQLVTGELRPAAGGKMVGRYSIGTDGSAMPVTGRLEGDTGFRTFLGVLHVMRDFLDEEAGLGVVAAEASKIPGLSQLLKLLSSDEICVPLVGRPCVNDNTLFDLWNSTGGITSGTRILNILADVLDLPNIPDVNFRKEMQDLTRRVARSMAPLIQSVMLFLSGESFQQRLLRTRAKAQRIIDLNNPPAFAPPVVQKVPGAVGGRTSGKGVGTVAVAIGGGVLIAALLARG